VAEVRDHAIKALREGVHRQRNGTFAPEGVVLGRNSECREHWVSSL
jgi:hypothetical protein